MMVRVGVDANVVVFALLARRAGVFTFMPGGGAGSADRPAGDSVCAVTL